MAEDEQLSGWGLFIGCSFVIAIYGAQVIYLARRPPWRRSTDLGRAMGWAHLVSLVIALPVAVVLVVAGAAGLLDS